MANKIQALVFITALYIPLSYSIGAPAGAPGESDTSLGRKSLDGVEEITKENVVQNILGAIPKFRSYIHILKNRMDKTPEFATAQKCLKTCLHIYEKEIQELKKYADVLAISATGEVDFESETDKEDVAKCDVCLVEVSKVDPKTAEDTQWFISEFDKIGKNVNIYNS